MNPGMEQRPPNPNKPMQVKPQVPGRQPPQDPNMVGETGGGLQASPVREVRSVPQVRDKLREALRWPDCSMR